MAKFLSATVEQIAWYIERDGGKIVEFEADGAQVVRVPLSHNGHVSYRVPAEQVAPLNEWRDRVYAQLRAKARAAAAR